MWRYTKTIAGKIFWGITISSTFFLILIQVLLRMNPWRLYVVHRSRYLLPIRYPQVFQSCWEQLETLVRNQRSTMFYTFLIVAVFQLWGLTIRRGTRRQRERFFTQMEKWDARDIIWMHGVSFRDAPRLATWCWRHLQCALVYECYVAINSSGKQACKYCFPPDVFCWSKLSFAVIKSGEFLYAYLSFQRVKQIVYNFPDFAALCGQM